MTALAELREFVSEQHEILIAFDRQLDPFWANERELKDLLICTHDWIDGIAAEDAGLRGTIDSAKYVTAFRFENRATRRDLFAELDRLIAVWGPVRARRRQVKADLDAATRTIERITEAAKKPRRKPVQLKMKLFN